MLSGQVEIWREKMTDEIANLARAIGVTGSPTDLSPRPAKRSPRDAFAPAERDPLLRLDDDAPVSREQELGLGAGAAAKWLIDKIGGAIVSILVQEGIAEMMDGPRRGMRRRTEYNLHTGNIIVRWDDGSVTYPRESP